MAASAACSNPHVLAHTLRFSARSFLALRKNHQFLEVLISYLFCSRNHKKTDQSGVLGNEISKAIFRQEVLGDQQRRVCSKKSVQQGRSPFCARSVLALREHGKRVRTPLAAFFNRPERILKVAPSPLMKRHGAVE